MFEYRIGRYIFTYSVELTAEQLDYFNIDYKSVYESYPNWVSTTSLSDANYSEVEAFKACKLYIFDFVDDSGLVALLNWKFEFRSLGLTKETNLTLAMIQGFETWIAKCWGVYDLKKQDIQANLDITLDYSSAGEPPCKFKDIQYTFDAALQALGPRTFNMEISYYLTWT